MRYVGNEDRIMPRRNWFLEEIASHNLNLLRGGIAVQMPTCDGGRGGQLEQRALQTVIPAQDGSQPRAGAPAEVQDTLVATKVVGGGEGLRRRRLNGLDPFGKMRCASSGRSSVLWAWPVRIASSSFVHVG